MNENSAVAYAAGKKASSTLAVKCLMERLRGRYMEIRPTKLRKSLRTRREGRIQWAKDNVPMLSVRSTESIENIVERADDDTHGMQVALNVVGSLLGVYFGYSLANEFFGDIATQWETVGSAAVAGAVAGSLANIAAEQLFRRKVRMMAGDTGDI